jgi:hypothetical protein
MKRIFVGFVCFFVATVAYAADKYVPSWSFIAESSEGKVMMDDNSVFQKTEKFNQQDVEWAGAVFNILPKLGSQRRRKTDSYFIAQIDRNECIMNQSGNLIFKTLKGSVFGVFTWGMSGTKNIDVMGATLCGAVFGIENIPLPDYLKPKEKKKEESNPQQEIEPVDPNMQ